GVSFGTSHEERDLASMLSGRPGIFTVACVHCDVDSASEGLSYAPCRLQDLSGRNVDYWALGHIHRRQVLSGRPYVVYPGNIQGRSFRETGPKGAYLVTVSSGVVTGLRFVPTQSMMWHDISVDITGRTLDDVASDISGRIRKGDLVRITFTGSGPLDRMLRTDADDVVSVIEGRTGCRIASWEVDTVPDIDIWSIDGGDDLPSKVVSAGRAISGDRQAVLDRIASNPVLSRHRAFFESLTDEELSKIAEDATRTVLAGMGASR
ncbi:MAG: exonuclease SbcCD subunit D, partial [Candidatus Methanomethylophilaceae archaeon]